MDNLETRIRFFLAQFIFLLTFTFTSINTAFFLPNVRVSEPIIGTDTRRKYTTWIGVLSGNIRFPLATTFPPGLVSATQILFPFLRFFLRMFIEMIRFFRFIKTYTNQKQKGETGILGFHIRP